MIDWNLFIYFTLGVLTGCTILGGFAFAKFSQYEEEIKRLKRKRNK